MNQKVEPVPGIESAPMVPPCISTNRFDKASPSPVPCACRLVEVSIWVNSLKSLGRSSGRIPIPESITLTQTTSCVTMRGSSVLRSDGTDSGARVRVADRVMVPPSPVNFEAFARRLKRICRTRTPSATTTSEESSSSRTSQT